ncbi:MAG: phosphate signaling complex protein PhoU [Eubacteriales bacterium]|nr:phosphate signaling complex protein PhoU [Eubacteriales bacterium]
MTTLFERQLEELHVLLITMGGLCEKAISLSAKAVQERGERAIVKEIFETDKEIDEREREIEDHCMRFLLHQHPVARDLREVSAALKMISDMERIGDQAADIADISFYIEKSIKIPEKIQEMAEHSVHMVTESVDSFVNTDLELCRKVIEDDDLVDGCFNEIKEELAKLIYGGELDARAGLDLLMTAKYFERIGDHAVNIAEWVEYSITGEHRNNEHQPRV